MKVKVTNYPSHFIHFPSTVYTKVYQKYQLVCTLFVHPQGRKCCHKIQVEGRNSFGKVSHFLQRLFSSTGLNNLELLTLLIKLSNFQVYVPKFWIVSDARSKLASEFSNLFFPQLFTSSSKNSPSFRISQFCPKQIPYFIFLLSAVLTDRVFTLTDCFMSVESFKLSGSFCDSSKSTISVQSS